MIVFGTLFLIQDLTIGQLRFLDDKIVFNILPFKYLLFTATSLIFILKAINFYIPERRK